MYLKKTLLNQNCDVPCEFEGIKLRFKWFYDKKNKIFDFQRETPE